MWLMVQGQDAARWKQGIVPRRTPKLKTRYSIVDKPAEFVGKGLNIPSIILSEYLTSMRRSPDTAETITAATRPRLRAILVMFCFSEQCISTL